MEWKASEGMQRDIFLEDVWTHHLKHLNVRFAQGRMTAVIGPSGSGKSSLLQDTLWAESLRQFADALAPEQGFWSVTPSEARLQEIRGLRPCVLVDASQRGNRGKLGDVLEIQAWLGRLFVQLGILHCPICSHPMPVRSAAHSIEYLLGAFEGQDRLRTWMIAPCSSLEEPEGMRSRLQAQGFARAWQMSQEVLLEDWTPEPTLELVVDRLILQAESKMRLQEALENAWAISDGIAYARLEGGGVSQKIFLPRGAQCPDHGSVASQIDPRWFQSHSVHSKCSHCLGEGFFEGYPCSKCHGTGLNPIASQVKIEEMSWAQLQVSTLSQIEAWVQSLKDHSKRLEAAQRLIAALLQRLKVANELGLGYLELQRPAGSLSTGEWQRARFAAHLGTGLSGVLYVLDEPSAGLHPLEVKVLMTKIRELLVRDNTVVYAEHLRSAIEQADDLLELGPGAGAEGGAILFAGTLQDWKQCSSPTRQLWAQNRSLVESEPVDAAFLRKWIALEGAAGRNLQNVDLRIPLASITGVCGVSGAGKSSLIIETLVPALQAALDLPGEKALAFDNLLGAENCQGVLLAATGVTKGTQRSNPATFMGIWDEMRSLFAALPEAQVLGLKAGQFSLNTKGGRCETCKGEGTVLRDLGALGQMREECPECLGRRFGPQVLRLTFKGKTLLDLLQMSVKEALALLRHIAPVAKRLHALCEVGLSYLELGRSSATLSAGEMQRMRLAKELIRPVGETWVYVFEEPARGLHSADLEVLKKCFRTLAQRGHAVILIEHNPDLLEIADWWVELGPSSGPAGGQILVQETRLKALKSPHSQMAKFMRDAYIREA
jgi:excinuclease ABC subunit A